MINKKERIIISKKILSYEKLSLLCKEKKNLKSVMECNICNDNDTKNNLKDICSVEGAYTKYKCENESITIIQGCIISKENKKKYFYIFSLFSMISTALFSYLAIDRRLRNNSIAYTRLNNLLT
uniref:PIR Superfamily Protein n=1 Tax=Parastrongyloides trichosuri TaxID=131310 RepID=A0A0N4Z306_PARTI